MGNGRNGALNAFAGDTRYWVRKRAQGRGIATETANATVRHAFGALGMRRIGLTHSGGNEASRRIAERLVFSFEGIQKGANVLPGGKHASPFSRALIMERLVCLRRSRDAPRPCGRSHGNLAAPAVSGRYRKMMATAFIMNIRKAAKSPFHAVDSHIMNHSPPTVTKAKAHSNKPSQRPASGTAFAASKPCWDRSKVAKRAVPTAQHEPAPSSHKMIVQ